MTPAYEKALKEGYTHCVSWVSSKDDPTQPWRQSFFKSLKEAKSFEKNIQSYGGRAMWGGMRAPCPR